MMEFAFDIGAALLERLVAPRAQAEQRDAPKADVAFGRLMESLKDRESDRERKVETPPSSPPTITQTFLAFAPLILPADSDETAGSKDEVAGRDAESDSAVAESPAAEGPEPMPAAPLPPVPVEVKEAPNVPTPRADIARACESSGHLATPSDMIRVPKANHPEVEATAPVNSGEREASNAPVRVEFRAQVERAVKFPVHDAPETRSALPDFGPRSEPASRQSAADSPKTAAAVELTKDKEPDQAQALPVKIHVNELQTHLPAAIASDLTQTTQSADQSEAVAPPRPAEPARESPVRVLRFEMEPAELGSIEVRMTVRHTRVDIKITADDPATMVLLSETRDVLASAVEESGRNLQSCEVSLTAATPASSPARAGEDTTLQNQQQQPFHGERGFASDERSNQRPRQSSPERPARRRGKIASGELPVGLVL